ncbi:extracellular solute-binding protein [Paenibacillus sp. B2(2019)]|uniref:extracellular solute-binding protein n=1 Tax=Paenibacillus sp. B2(2019) TaxID=2607754 RepID=UPI0011F0ECFB|nr:extracellular solute-binding protein [Paenibacillus sp. B2(2019)]KAA1183410.1 extracellular solute-binding protein [Paenibacillus sp. B2(2019)]
MRKGKKKLLTIGTSLFLTASLFAGCSGNAKTGETTSNTSTEAPTVKEEAVKEETVKEATGIDTSKKVELQFYMLGDAPKDLKLIQDEVNKMALEDLNATVKFNFTTWTDWDQKYKLLLSSGQPIDLIFTAEWTNYQSYAMKGAFLPLDDLIPKAAPKLQAYVPQDFWEAVKVDKKIYTVPAIWKEYVNDGIAYREDLRKKYNLPKPESLETLEQYLDGIRKNEPDMLPLADTEVSHVDSIRQMTTKTVNTNDKVPYGLSIMYDTPRDVTSYWGSPQHLEDLKMFRSWQEKGYFMKNMLNIKDSGSDIFAAGKAAAILGSENPNRFGDAVVKVKSLHPDWELGYSPYPNMKGFSSPVHPIHNGFAVPRSSKNPERALAFYEKLVTDKRYNWLTQYGIEGKNFEIEDGKYYKMLGDAQSNGFTREGMNGWAWRNPEFMLFDKSYQAVLDMFDEMDKIAKPNIFQGFGEDWTSYQAEKAALLQVEKQYLYPLNDGMVKDVEAGLKLFMEKAKKAGLDKIQAEYTKQWLQYLDDANIK